jgi:WD40 repeat protein
MGIASNAFAAECVMKPFSYLFCAGVAIASAITFDNDAATAADDDTASKEVRRFEGHPNIVTCMALSPDGHRALAGMKDGAIWLWDVDDAKVVRKMQIGKDEITSLVFQADGKRWLCGTKQGLVVLWDTDTGKEQRRYEGHRDIILALAFIKKNKHLLSCAGGVDGTMRLWDLAKGGKVDEERLGKGTAHIYSAAFAPEGKGLATGYATRLGLCDGTGDEVGKLEGHKGRVVALAYTPDGKLLASGSKDKTLRIWNVAEKREHRLHEGHKGSVTAVCFSANGQRLLSGGDDNTVRLWDVNKQLVQTFEGHSGPVSGVAFSPDGSFALSASHDKTMRMWRLPK